MTQLAHWLRRELDLRGLTLTRAAVAAGVGQATLSDILTKGHVPRLATLVRLADYFRTPRDEVLRLAAGQPELSPALVGGGGKGSSATRSGDVLVEALLAEFRKLPEEWKAEAVAQVQTFVRLATRPPVRVVGDEAPGDEGQSGEQEEAGEEEGDGAEREGAAADAATRAA